MRRAIIVLQVRYGILSAFIYWIGNLPEAVQLGPRWAASLLIRIPIRSIAPYANGKEQSSINSNLMIQFVRGMMANVPRELLKLLR